MIANIEGNSRKVGGASDGQDLEKIFESECEFM